MKSREHETRSAYPPISLPIQTICSDLTTTIAVIPRMLGLVDVIESDIRVSFCRHPITLGIVAVHPDFLSIGNHPIAQPSMLRSMAEAGAREHEHE
jgi:hypothetical protein